MPSFLASMMGQQDFSGAPPQQSIGDYAAEYSAPMAKANRQLQEQAAAPITKPGEIELTPEQRKQQWLKFGLNLMQAGGDIDNNLFSAVGQAGRASLADIDQMKQQQYAGDLADQERKAGALQQTQEYLQGRRDFAADRSDAQWGRRTDQAGIRQGDDKIAQMGQYRDAQIAAKQSALASLDNHRAGTRAISSERLAQDAAYNDARIADIQTGDAGTSGKPNLGDDQVMLRNGNRPYDMGELRQMYKENYGQYDPQSQMYSFSEDTPRFEEWLSTVVTPESNPMNASQPRQSGLEMLRAQAGKNRQMSDAMGQTPYSAPVPMRGGTDHSAAWK